MASTKFIIHFKQQCKEKWQKKMMTEMIENTFFKNEQQIPNILDNINRNN